MGRSDEVELSPNQQKVLDTILNSDQKVFSLVGPGGSGKTTIIRELVKRCGSRQVMLTATTNNAATLLGRGARTLHRAFKLFKTDVEMVNLTSRSAPDFWGTDSDLATTCRYLETKRGSHNTVQFIVVDEASMLSGNNLHAFIVNLVLLCWRVRAGRKPRHPKQLAVPFLDSDEQKAAEAAQNAVRASFATGRAASNSGAAYAAPPYQSGREKPSFGQFPKKVPWASQKQWAKWLKSNNVLQWLPKIVFVGDFMQYEPIKPEENGGYVWDTVWWSTVFPVVKLILETNYRAAEDPPFAQDLSKIRIGQVPAPNSTLHNLKVVPLEKVKQQLLDSDNPENDKAFTLLLGRNEGPNGVIATNTEFFAKRRAHCHCHCGSCQFSSTKNATNCVWKNMAAIDTFTAEENKVYLDDLKAALPDAQDLCVGTRVLTIANVSTKENVVKGRRGTVVALGRTSSSPIDLVLETVSGKTEGVWPLVFSHPQDTETPPPGYCIEWDDCADKIKTLNLPHHRVWMRGEPAPTEIPPLLPICVVEFDDAPNQYFVFKKYMYSHYAPQWDEKKQNFVDQVVATRTQWPFLLAYAITGHRAQGMTLDNVCLVLASHEKDYGSGGLHGNHALYVGLSRARTAKKVVVTRPIDFAMHMKINKAALLQCR